MSARQLRSREMRTVFGFGWMLLVAACSACSGGGDAPNGVGGSPSDGSGGSPADECKRDEDGDGFCAYSSGDAEADCDDGNPDVYPGATETCNVVDDDCNGLVDDGDGAPLCALTCGEPEEGCSTGVKMVADAAHVCVLSSVGDVYCWGKGVEAGEPRAESVKYLQKVPHVSGATDLLLARGATCAVMSDHFLCWGATPFPYEFPLPEEATDAAIYSDVSDGATYHCYVVDGALVCERFLPYEGDPQRIVYAETGVTSIDAHRAIVCAVMDTGAVHCWGSVSSNFTIDTELVSAGANDVWVGEETICAKVDGELRCWSEELTDYEGVGSVVAGMGSASSVLISEDSSCALNDAGRFTCWRGPHFTELMTAQAAAVAKGFGCAVQDASLACWGEYPLRESDASTLETIHPALGDQAPEVPLLFETEGACNNIDDVALLMAYTSPVEYARNCASMCSTALDPDTCFIDCFPRGDTLSAACLACLSAYGICRQDECKNALTACAGFTVP